MECGCGKEATHLVQVSPINAMPLEWQEMCWKCTLEYIGAEPVMVINLRDWEAKQRGKGIARTA
jgi:hypothetical protein